MEKVMRKYLVFDCINTDTLAFNQGEIISADKSYNLFTPEDDGIEDNITNEDEEQILKLFMNSEGSRLLLSKLEISQNPFRAFSVRKPIDENPKHSDIDLILCEPELPQFSIGFQCKRLKIVSLNEGEDEINKLPDIKKAVTQANKQRENLGFHRNYLIIISEIFGRKFTSENTLFRKARPDTRQKIYDFPQRESLHDDVGIIFVEIGQPTGKSFRKQRNICIRIDKEASRLDQTPNLTHRVRELMRFNGFTP